MKFKVKKETLLKGLQKICNIVGSRTTIPIVANVVIDAKDNTLTMTTTDFEIRFSTVVEAEVEVPGITTIPAKRLLGLVSKFKAADITFDSNENCNTTITCGTGKFMLLGLDPKDFPEPIEFTPVRQFKLKQTDFSRMIERISYAVSLDDSRKVLHGILFSVQNGSLTAVSTDGKRLALVEKVLDEAPQGADGDVIVTLKAATEARRVLDKEGDIIIEIGEKLITFKIGPTTIVSKLLEGNYPQYKAVIPQSFTKSVKIPCSSFIDALDIVSIPLFDASAYVRLLFKKNNLEFEANSTSIGEGHENISVEYEGEDITVSFNPQYLGDPFRHLDVESVQLKMNDAFNPIAIESADGFLYVIMPMRKN